MEGQQKLDCDGILHSVGDAWAAVFPFNSFAWTLFYELFANILHALLLRKRSTKTLLTLCALSGIAYLHTIFRLGSGKYGTLTAELPIGIPRVLFSYLVGILLFRLWSRRPTALRVPMVYPALLLIAGLAVPNLPSAANPWFELCMLLIVLPAIVYLGALSAPPVKLHPLAISLGAISYAIYLIQGIVHFQIDLAWRYIAHHPATNAAPASGFIYLLLLPAVSWLVDRYFDTPIRRWLRRTLHA